jgi:hypothetical protein
MPRIPSLAVALLTVLFAACATPASRIKDSPDVFAQATPEQQALIQKGQIALGFRPEFVKLALGEPDRITERTDASGTETIWHYTDVSTVPAYAGYAYYDPLLFGPPFYYGPGFWGPPFAPLAYAPPPAAVETDRVRIIFRSNAVTAVERVVKSY